MNEACIILAEEMTSIWLNPISQALRRPCPSLSCCVYRELKTDPDPQGVSRGVEGSGQWGGHTDPCDWVSLPPLLCPLLIHKSQYLYALWDSASLATSHPLLDPAKPYLAVCLHLPQLNLQTPGNSWRIFITVVPQGVAGERGRSWWAGQLPILVLIML